MKKQTSFREELREALIGHALIPCVMSVLVLIIAITAAGVFLTVMRGRQISERFAGQFTEMTGSYSGEADAISETLSIRDFCENPSYQTQILSDIYHFLNRQTWRGEFYLFDSERNCLFSTSRDEVTEGYLKNFLSGIRPEKDTLNSEVLLYDSWNLRRETGPLCIMLRRVVNGGVTAGYEGFAVSSDVMEKTMAVNSQYLIVSNRFDRVFASGTSLFTNERGKLCEELRRGKGFFLYESRWYYSASVMIPDGLVRVFAIFDCSALFQLILISVLVVATLSAVMVFFIYHSAEMLATSRTDIVYQLVDALEEVKGGNLDVTLDIHSNDEFESIGSSFNMMLGSIRHLLDRHHQLIRENAMAMVQALESQFNPHFLFNTLEAIRYLIRFEPKKAEKMIVSLSRLLHYSIRGGDEPVSLREEIEFVDRYLQIMMERYGERLCYRIEAEDKIQKAEIPRMILQPIVENSIRYGIDGEKTIHIRIAASLKKENLELLISDDGKGIDSKLLFELRENLKHGHNHTEHIGLYNVHRRICLLYGENYGLSVESERGRGTCVKLVIPARLETADGEEGA